MHKLKHVHYMIH